MPRKVGVFLAAAALAGGMVAYFGLRGRGEPPVAAGQLIKARADLTPDALYSSKAEYHLSGLVLPVELRRKLDGNLVKFELIAEGTPIDTEVYLSDDKAFGLKEMNMESYEPAIPLLKFPMHIGDTWEWKGAQESGGRNHKSWAKITSTIETLPNQVETVKVTVDLFVDSNAGKASERNLVFWFTKGRGIIKRTYGDPIARVSLDPGDIDEKE